MFKNLDNVFEKRKKVLNKSLDKNRQINAEVSNFFKKEFGEKIRGSSIVVNYNNKEESLVIVTENKILANELSYRMVELSEFLKNRSICLNKILIR
jgi:hypothetical protein